MTRAMPRFAANLNWLFTEWPLRDRFAAAADAGFAAVEVLAPYELPASEIAALLARHRLKAVLFNSPAGNAGERGLAALPQRVDDFRASVDLALSYARDCGVPRLHMLAGLADRRDAPAVAAYRNAVAWAAERAAVHAIDVMLEPINPRDIAGYFLNDFDFAADLIRALALPNVKLQFDIYHRQILHGDISEGLQQLLPLIGHIQIAGVPGRNEPDEACEVNFPFLFAALDRLGYAGYVSAEYRPRAGTVEGLGWFAPYAGRGG